MEKKFYKLFSDLGLFGFLKLICNFILTKLFFPSSRLIRFPINIRGKSYIDFGINLTTGYRLRIDAFGGKQKTKKIIFGKNIQLNDDVHIASISKVVIGNNTLIASKVFISDHHHGIYNRSNCSDPNIPPIKRVLDHRDVIIGENVWIGEGVIILPGTTIGNGAIVGGGSVVTKDVNKNTIVVGNPALPIKKYNKLTKKWERIKK